MKETPMMKQYLGFKQQYPDKILLFRMGDFFETFGEDAKLTSKILNITLTTRDKKTNPTPLAGFPHKALEQYLPKIIEAGYSAVIVDQLEDPKLAQGIVKRGVTRIVTPGTLDGDQAHALKNSYLAVFYKDKKDISSVLCDVSTGELLLASGKYSQSFIDNILASYEPVEILLLEGEKELKFSNIPVQFVKKSLRNNEYASELVKEFYELQNTESLDIKTESTDIVALGMTLAYIEETQLMDPKHILKPRRIKLNKTMVLDRATIRNLELVANAYTGDIQGSLFGVLDNTSTRMGRRLLYSWVLTPLIDKKQIDFRLNTIETLQSNTEGLYEIKSKLEDINDIERIVGKIGLQRANARDFKALELSLQSVLEIKKLLKEKLQNSKILELDEKLINTLVDKIEKNIADEPPTSITEGWIIKKGVNDELDELKSLTGDSKTWLKEFEEKEKEKTGITNLKISFNKVFGYYIEVTKSHQEKVPDTYIRKQTLVNSERYITEELKEKENIILNAEEKIGALEYRLFCDFRDSFIPNLEILQELSRNIAQLDILIGFADLSIKNEYIKPTIYDIGEKDGILNIKNGRHPIVEHISEEEFISNDTYLDLNGSNMAILTGPNMSGKSTYIRQVAVIVLMAQLGCFVPAKDAEISLVDRIFTRVGASDDLSRGRSTFMVEMDEAANIVNNATKYSLIILDEIGRGTSTYDGVSIAWALAEYLVNETKARTMFATHYHELLKLSERIPQGIRNFNVLVEEDLESGEVIFLRKIVEGGTDRSYGIYVAKMAGLPDKVIVRANEILEGFEQESMFDGEKIKDVDVLSKESKEKITGMQFPLFTATDSEIERDIQKLDVDNLTPIEALNKISEWKKKL
jgi:DNA mismatch repair protein MutS